MAIKPIRHDLDIGPFRPIAGLVYPDGGLRQSMEVNCVAMFDNRPIFIIWVPSPFDDDRNTKSIVNMCP